MPKRTAILFNLRVTTLVLAWWWPGIESVIFWVILADYCAWLLSYPERGVDLHVFRKSDFPGQLYEFVPNKRFNFYFGSRRLWKKCRAVKAEISSQGFRGPEIMARSRENAFRILVLGDSITFGAGVADGEEFIRLVEKKWNQEKTFHSGIELINTSVGGYNTTQEAATLKRYQSIFQPDMVWMVISVEDTFHWGKVVVKEDGTLFRPGAPFRNRLRRYSSDFSGLIWWLAFAERFLRADNHIPRLFRDNFPGYHEWKRALRQYADLVGTPNRSLVFLAPGNWKLHNYPWKSVHEQMKKDVENYGLTCLDLLPAVEGQNTFQLWCHPIDPHPNALSHRLFADFIAGHPQVLKQVSQRIEEVKNVHAKISRT